MSLITIILVPGGIVMSADSRATVTVRVNQKETSRAVLSDAVEKLFVLPGNLAVAAFGDIGEQVARMGKLISAIGEELPAEGQTVRARAEALMQSLNGSWKLPALRLIVAGFTQNEPELYALNTSKRTLEAIHLCPSGNLKYTGIFGGETSVVDRIMAQPAYNPKFELMPLQTAIDFSRHLIRISMEQMAFEPRFPTVGGEIDTLVIRPTGTQWIYRKSLKLSPSPERD